MCGLLLLLMVVLVVAGPREARGDTPNLLISSHNDNMLLSADGEQTVIGPGKLRVTGKLKLRPPCGRYSRLKDSASATEGSGEGHLSYPSTHFYVSFKVVK